MEEHLITIENLEKCYNKQAVLSNIHLTIKKGEIHALLGKNGAGKSTLFKLIAGIATATNGKITVCGGSPTDDKTRRKIGFTVNEPVFYEHLSAVKNLEIHADYYNTPYEAIPLTLRNVEIEPNNPIPMREYSQGMRQRVSIARMLLHRPALLIIDEPLNGLDPKGMRDFREMLEDLRKAGTTILLSSHILSEIQQVATNISVLSKGEIVASLTENDWREKEEVIFENDMIEMMEGNDA